MNRIPPRFSGKRVMVVDDDSLVRETIAKIVRQSGCDVTPASSGNEALDIFANSTFDLVISDIRMPNGSGLDMLKGIRSVGRDGTKVILASGYFDLSNDQAVELGAEALLQKPFNGRQLLTLMEASLVADLENKPAVWMKKIGSLLFRDPADSGNPSYILARAREWLESSGYHEIRGHPPLEELNCLYGVELREAGPCEAIVQLETHESLAHVGSGCRFESIFRWKMAKPELRKIAIALPGSAGENRNLAFYDEVILC